MSAATDRGAKRAQRAGARKDRGRPPRTPLHLSFAEWKDVLRRTVSQFIADDCTGLAQQIAYSSLLAFFPAAAFAVGLLGIFHLFDEVISLLSTVAPHGVISFVRTLAKDSRGSGTKVTAFVLGLVGAVWAASGAMNSVIKAVNRAYDRQETRPFWRVRITAIVLVLLSGATTILTLVLIVFGGKLGDAITRKAGFGNAFTVVWDVLRWPITFAAILLFFAFVYYLAPNQTPRRWQWITPGSIVGSMLWLALSGLFALYVTYAGHYTKTYGALASGVILLLWLNYSAWSLLLGAELNAELDRQASIHAAGGPRAGLVRLARR